jgi:trigger factor
MAQTRLRRLLDSHERFLIILLEEMVQTSVEILPTTSEAVITLTWPWDALQKASDKTFRNLVQKIDVPGFRRGKAPRAVLERRLGGTYIYEEAFKQLFPDAYRDVVKEHNLSVISEPKLDMPTITLGEPCEVSFTIPIIVSPKLPDYRSMHFEREDVFITSEEIDQELEKLRQSQATWQTVSRPVQYGDRVRADLKLEADGRTISDLKENLFEVVQDRVGLFSGMDEHLVGMTAGEQKTFTTTIPADYTNQKLAGQEAHYDVLVHAIEEKTVPELDDAFALKVSEEQNATIEEFSKVLSDALLEKKKKRIHEELQDKILDAVVEQSEIVVHPSLVDSELESMLAELETVLKPEHITVNQYLRASGKSREEALQNMRISAEARVKRNLVIDEIVGQEKLSFEPEEIPAFLEKYAPGSDFSSIQTREQAELIALACLRDKAVQHLVALTTDPDLDEEGEAQAREEVNALTAALAAEQAATESELLETSTEESPAEATNGATAEEVPAEATQDDSTAVTANTLE